MTIVIFDAKGVLDFCDHDWYTSLMSVHNSQLFATSQMALLDEAKMYYDIICILDTKKMILISKNQDGTWDCDSTERLLRDGHSFFNLWKGGEFG